VAETMLTLIVMRAVTGFGGGGLITMGKSACCGPDPKASLAETVP
jgi:hypothetical protein